MAMVTDVLANETVSVITSPWRRHYNDVTRPSSVSP